MRFANALWYLVSSGDSVVGDWFTGTGIDGVRVCQDCSETGPSLYFDVPRFGVGMTIRAVDIAGNLSESGVVISELSAVRLHTGRGDPRRGDGPRCTGFRRRGETRRGDGDNPRCTAWRRRGDPCTRGRRWMLHRPSRGSDADADPGRRRGTFAAHFTIRS